MKIAYATFKIWHFSGQGIGWSGPHKRLYTIENVNLSNKEIEKRVIETINDEFYEYEGKVEKGSKDTFELIISNSIL